MPPASLPDFEGGLLVNTCGKGRLKAPQITFTYFERFFRSSHPYSPQHRPCLVFLRPKPASSSSSHCTYKSGYLAYLSRTRGHQKPTDTAPPRKTPRLGWRSVKQAGIERNLSALASPPPPPTKESLPYASIPSGRHTAANARGAHGGTQAGTQAAYLLRE